MATIMFECTIGKSILCGDFRYSERLDIKSKAFKEVLFEHIGRCFKEDLNRYKVNIEYSTSKTANPSGSS